MPFLIIFLIWYLGYARNNPGTYKRVEGKVGKIIFALVLLSVFGSFIGPVLGLFIALLVMLLTFSPVLVIGYVLYKVLGGGKNKQQKRGREQVNYNETTYTRESFVSGLTKSVPKRRKIVKKFNKKFGLNLTDEEIDRIVDASYVSNGWEAEVNDMQKEYDTLSQWFRGNRGWLRIYLSQFPVHTISSDFERQRQICNDTYTHIFDNANPGAFGTVESCIDAINSEYFTSIDETSFMIIYRYLESIGKRYDLPSLGIIRNESELDKLRKKYDETSDAKVESVKQERRKI